MPRLGLQVLGKKTTEMGCVSHHITSGVHVLMWLIPRDTNPDHLAQWHLPGLPTIKLLSLKFLVFPFLLFASESLSSAHI